MLIDAIRFSYGLDDILIRLVSSLAVIFFTLPIHEFAHGFVSTKLGDPTPRYQGRLTLNPMAHIDWMGTMGILLFGIGWAKPVQVNARYYKNPKWGMALVAFAGPLSNVILAFFALLLHNLIYFNGLTQFSILYYAWSFLYFVAVINVRLAIFNLIPVPPFDGSRILFAILPQKYYFQIMRYERYIFIAVFAIIYSGVLNLPLDLLTNKLIDAVYFLASIPFTIFGV